MARKLTKPVEVQKFGGVDKLGTAEQFGHSHEVESVEVESKTKIQDDIGYGKEAIIRMFEFQGNPEIWNQHPPTKQDLVNYHAQGIRLALWRDGLEANEDIGPRVQLSEKSFKYRIFVTAKPARGHLMPTGIQPKTLNQIIHGD